jgi:hypothetical protein
MLMSNGRCAHTLAHRLIEAGAHRVFDCMSALPEMLHDTVQPKHA